EIIAEPLQTHGVPKAECEARVRELMRTVGLMPDHLNRFPTQFSGGQRQRIGIARGIALKPKVLVCDEPVSALDVSVQGQILELLVRLQEEHALAYLFISHDLAVVRQVADEVGVLHRGRLVEVGRPEDVLARPTQEYTRELVAAIPGRSAEQGGDAD
ncbi:MAG TPA: peptide ABC transporter ATP-binding protein, partial [Micrococcales bacterium]|nr:peptide ABC transporter ATP-binding protein [Micrococcales bacterium]